MNIMGREERKKAPTRDVLYKKGALKNFTKLSGKISVFDSLF